MGAINPSKMPKGKKIVRKDSPNDVEVYKKGGSVGLYANIHAKRERGGKMRKPGDPGAPTADDFKQSAKTAKKK
jgi:hypothetical protein